MKKITLLLGMLLISIISFSQYSFQIIEYKASEASDFSYTEGKINYEKDLLNLYDSKDKLVMSLQTDSCTTIFDNILYCQGYELFLHQRMAIAIKSDTLNNVIYWEFQYAGGNTVFKTKIK